jgi:hypothetical protein
LVADDLLHRRRHVLIEEAVPQARPQRLGALGRNQPGPIRGDGVEMLMIVVDSGSVRPADSSRSTGMLAIGHSVAASSARGIGVIDEVRAKR